MSILEIDETSCRVDFLEKINSDNLLAKMAKNVADVCYLPPHTVYLAGLGVFSSIACRAYSVEYEHGGDLPIGLYIMVEQPSGASKSRALNIFQKPFRDARLDEIKRDSMTVRSELDDEKPITRPPLFVTNATPEALEETLKHSKGFFSAISSEQGLANAILGASYGDSSRANNNDVLLNGFDAGYIASLRISRNGYEGHVVGGTTVIAQAGSIERLLDTSNGTGLAERFLMLSENHLLGTRDFINDRKQLDKCLLEKYKNVCEFIYKKAFNELDEYRDIFRLKICEFGHELINAFRHGIEPELADGGKFSDVAIRGSAAKIDMQIMKIAANLHLASRSDVCDTVISSTSVLDAIEIAKSMLSANIRLNNDKGISGERAEYESILSLFENNNVRKPELTILQVKARTKPFKDMSLPKGTGKRDYIRSVLQNMVIDNILDVEFNDGTTKNPTYRVK